LFGYVSRLLHAVGAGPGDSVAFGILDWVDWAGLAIVALLILNLALLWLWWFPNDD
jgi:hypothetical protein